MARTTTVTPPVPVVTKPTGGPSGLRSLAPLAAVEAAFQALNQEPRRLCVQAGDIDASLPSQLIPVAALRAILKRRDTPSDVREAIWRHAVMEAQRCRGDWLVVAAAMMLPALHRMARTLYRPHLDRFDVESELLTGFLTALEREDETAARIWERLGNSALTQARTALGLNQSHQQRRANRNPPAERSVASSWRASRPTPGPDSEEMVLRRAAVAGVITEDEARLIALTRLGGVALVELAAASGRSFEAMAKARRRAELRLADAISNGDLQPLYAYADASVAIDAEFTAAV